MESAQLGFVKRLVLDHRVRVDGPDPLESAAYAKDYREMKSLGEDDSSTRGDWQTETASFFNFNGPIMFGNAVIDMLEQRSMGVRRTALLFATMHGSQTGAVINCWRHKYDDGNPATKPEPGWASLLPTPPYSDYVSGHGCLTGPAIETLRMMLGERTS